MFPNMSYCMCENTLAALQQVQESGIMAAPDEDINEQEARARVALYRLICEMAAEHQDGEGLDGIYEEEIGG